MYWAITVHEQKLCCVIIIDEKVALKTAIWAGRTKNHTLLREKKRFYEAHETYSISTRLD